MHATPLTLRVQALQWKIEKALHEGLKGCINREYHTMMLKADKLLETRLGRRASASSRSGKLHQDYCLMNLNPKSYSE